MLLSLFVSIYQYTSISVFSFRSLSVYEYNKHIFRIRESRKNNYDNNNKAFILDFWGRLHESLFSIQLYQDSRVIFSLRLISVINFLTSSNHVGLGLSQVLVPLTNNILLLLTYRSTMHMSKPSLWILSRHILKCMPSPASQEHIHS